jgi:ATP-dependent RNA helicase RhlE
MAFEELGLSPEVLKGIQAMGYVDPTPIQLRAIPPVLAGQDVIGLAQTGTGKTAAFALPILTRLAKPGGLRALILEPTRELAAQVETAFRDYARFSEIRPGVVYGGVGYGQQREMLKQGVDVLVATPGRLLDYMEQGEIRLQGIECLVLDEMDRMLDMGFMPDVRRIVEKTPRTRQTMFFSATMPPEVDYVAKQFLKDPVVVEIGARQSPAETVRHALYPVARDQKFDLLLALLERTNYDSVLIFSRTKDGADRISHRFEGGESFRGGAALQPDPDRADRGARRFPQRPIRGDGGDGHRLPRTGHRGREPRDQLRRAAASGGLRPPHRPHGPGPKRRRRVHALLR